MILVAMLDRCTGPMRRAPARPAGHARIQRMLLAVALALAVPSVAAPDADHQCIGSGRLAAADRTCVAVQVCATSSPLCGRMASEESLTRIRDPHLPQQTPTPRTAVSHERQQWQRLLPLLMSNEQLSLDAYASLISACFLLCRLPRAKRTRCSASPRRPSQRARAFPPDGSRRHLRPKP